MLPDRSAPPRARAARQCAGSRGSDECIAAREMYYNAYLDKGLTLELLQEWSPFVDREIVRHGLARRE
ncbi:hypothetical protein [Sorangium sp. So ce1078]|uniref:hypothetical protein n=1 Tax=Sorangium sp. So ce1078 TaxID=3133329 RepID=UPI003F63D943